MWQVKHQNTNDAFERIHKAFEAQYEGDAWKDEVSSAFSTALWYGLDVREFVKAMTKAEDALTRGYGTMDDARTLLLDLEEIR